MKLYMAYTGGAIEGLSIEAHDVCFLAAEEMTCAVEMAKARWPGKPGSAHVDALREVSHVGGFEIRLSEAPTASLTIAGDRLFFVNIGFYREGVFGELHDVTLVVAKSEALASACALRNVDQNSFLAHKDDVRAVDNVRGISCVDGYSVLVRPSDSPMCDTLFYGPSSVDLSVQ